MHQPQCRPCPCHVDILWHFPTVCVRPTGHKRRPKGVQHGLARQIHRLERSASATLLPFQSANRAWSGSSGSNSAQESGSLHADHQIVVHLHFGAAWINRVVVDDAVPSVVRRTRGKQRLSPPRCHIRVRRKLGPLYATSSDRRIDDVRTGDERQPKLLGLAQPTHLAAVLSLKVVAAHFVGQYGQSQQRGVGFFDKLEQLRVGGVRQHRRGPRRPRCSVSSPVKLLDPQLLGYTACPGRRTHDRIDLQRRARHGLQFGARFDAVSRPARW